MTRSLSNWLLGDVLRVVGMIMVLLALIIYISGFLIVNLYLGQFGATDLELVEPRLVGAGLLFVFISGISGLFALVLLVGVSELIDLAAWIWENPRFERYWIKQGQTSQPAAGVKGNKFFSLSGQALGWRLNRFAAGVLLVVAVLTFFWLFTRLESTCSQITALLLTISPSVDLTPKLKPLTHLQGLSAFFVGMLGLKANRLYRVVLRGTILLTTILLLSFQAYSLIWFTDRLYGELPRSVGGGKPALVQFVAGRHELQILEELGVPIFFPAPAETLGKTQVVQLIYQTRGEASPAKYLILPCGPARICAPIEFDSGLVLGVVHYTFDQSP